MEIEPGVVNLAVFKLAEEFCEFISDLLLAALLVD
jgi:hypothetical protein